MNVNTILKQVYRRRTDHFKFARYVRSYTRSYQEPASVSIQDVNTTMGFLASVERPLFASACRPYSYSVSPPSHFYQDTGRVPLVIPECREIAIVASILQF